MKPADDREETLFREARQRAKGPERDAFLNEACLGNQALHARLQALLQAHESPDPFLEPQVAARIGAGYPPALAAEDPTVRSAAALLESHFQARDLKLMQQLDNVPALLKRQAE